MAEKSLVYKSNLQALKDAWEKKNQRNAFKYWKPIDNGKYIIRFLPPNTSNGLFYKEAAQHHIGDSYYFCPKVEGERCPICEYYKSLYDKGTDDAIALAKEIKPRKQYLYNIVVKNENGKVPEDTSKVQVYMSGKMLFDVIMDYFFDSDYGDLSDTDKGYDFMIVKEDGEQGFPSYKKSKPRKEPTPLADDKEVEKILGNIKDLDKEIEFKTYDELKTILEAFRGGAQKNADNFFESGKKDKSSDDDDFGTPAQKKSEAPVVDDTDDFEKELMNQLNSK